MEEWAAVGSLFFSGHSFFLPARAVPTDRSRWCPSPHTVLRPTEASGWSAATRPHSPLSAQHLFRFLFLRIVLWFFLCFFVFCIGNLSSPVPLLAFFLSFSGPLPPASYFLRFAACLCQCHASGALRITSSRVKWQCPLVPLDWWALDNLTMGIYSTAIWLSSVSLASTAVASGIAFSTAGFEGAAVYFEDGTPHQSTILNTTQITNGNAGEGKWMIRWSAAEPGNYPTINSVVLATEQDSGTSIAYGIDSTSTALGTIGLLSGRNTISQDGSTQSVFLGMYCGICAAMGEKH